MVHGALKRQILELERSIFDKVNVNLPTFSRLEALKYLPFSIAPDTKVYLTYSRIPATKLTSEVIWNRIQLNIGVQTVETSWLQGSRGWNLIRGQFQINPPVNFRTWG